MKQKIKLKQKEVQKKIIVSNEKSVQVSLKLPFTAKTFNELGKENEILQKFVAKLEKKFHQNIWYIGTDLFEDGIYERFTFAKGGFMEIKLGNSELSAYFDSNEKAINFKMALIDSLKLFSKSKFEIKLKEEFIKFEEVFK